MLSLPEILSLLAALAAVGAVFRIPTHRSVFWFVASAAPCAVLTAAAVVLHADLNTRSGFAWAYVCVIIALLCVTTILKGLWLDTKGVIEIPDGKPNDPDKILRQFPVVGPLSVHPPNTPWNGPLSRGGGANGSSRLSDLVPWSPDPPEPKRGEWTEEREGKTVRLRWAPETYRETLGQRVVRYFRWVLMGPLLFSAGIWLILSWRWQHEWWTLQIPAAGVCLILTSHLNLRFVLRGSRLFSQLIVDSPTIVVAGRVRNPARVSAMIEVIILSTSFAIVGVLLRYVWLVMVSEYRSQRLDVPFVTACAAFYAAVCLGIVCFRTAWDSIRPISQGRLADLNIPSISKRSIAPLHVAHWSDLHLTADAASPMLDGRASPNNDWQRLLTQFSKQPPPELILMTGDQTNAGQAGEWKFFFDTVQQLPPAIRERMILLPGNHDLNLAHPTKLARADADLRRMWYVRAMRSLAAIDHIQGERAWVIADGDTRKDDKVVRLRDLLDPVRAELASFIADPPQLRQAFQVSHIPLVGFFQRWVDATPETDRRRFRLPVDVWPVVFPMVVEEPQTGALVYVIDSNAIGGHLINNAFGHIRWDHAVQLRRLQRHFGDRPSFFLLHHHLALPPNPLRFALSKPRDAVMRRFMVLDNPSDLIAALPHNRATVIFHGHRHVGYHGQLGRNLRVVSAPSTTLGDEGATPRHEGVGYSEFGVDLTFDGGTTLRDEHWIPY